MKKLYQFTEEEEVLLIKQLDELRERLSLFFQDHLVKDLTVWKEECGINGSAKTLERVNAHIKSFEIDENLEEENNEHPDK